MIPLTPIRTKQKQYHYCMVVFDGRPVNVEYERDEDGDEINIISAEFFGWNLLERLNAQAVLDIEKLIEANEKQQYVEFCIGQAD